MSGKNQFFKQAAEIYAEAGVDVNRALETLGSIRIGIHAWQGDDVVGFEGSGATLTGGCQVTGNYPGRARNADELRADLDFAMKLIPGRHRVGLQGHQVDRMIPGVDRDGYTPEQFSGWLDWAKERKLGLEIAPAFYAHPKLDHNLSLAHPDKGVREFWIGHGRACREISAGFGKALGVPAVCNFWAPDGFKDTPADRLAPRIRLMESLDRCFEKEFPAEYERDAVESKLFGIGCESCTVGSHEFYLLYAAKRGKMVCLDSGHFHPTESIADKLSAIFTMMDELLLHVSRGVRWDSDHVLLLNDELSAIARESVACGCLDKIHFGLDYFDASINRTAAWTVGTRNMQKALLIALLEPRKMLVEAERRFDFTSRMAGWEAAKTLPWGAVWNHFCELHGVPDDFGVMPEVRGYETGTLSKRG